MIGQRIEVRRRPPILAALFGVVGLALLGTWVALGNAHLAIGAILPIALCVSLFLAREPDFAARFTDEAIEVEHPPTTVSYADLEGLQTRGRPIDPDKPPGRSFPIEVAHAGGLLRLPARLDVPSAEVYRFLVGRFDPRGSREVHPNLLDYLERQESNYGPEQVWTFRAARRRPVQPSYRALRAICLAMVATSVAWTAIGLLHRMEDGWGPVGIILGVIGLIFFLASFARQVPKIKGWNQSSLVVSPGGMAMVQGEIQGEMSWPELLDVRMNFYPRGFRFAAEPTPTGIVVRVRGAKLVIADLYDRPLSVIYERIVDCRSGQAADS